MSRSAYLIIITLLAGATANAEPAAHTTWNYNAALGIGDAPCQTWSKGREKSGAIAEENRQWVLGYLSRNNVNEHGVIILRDEANGIIRQLDKYCLEHPTENVMAATTALIIRAYDARGRVLQSAIPRQKSK